MWISISIFKLFRRVYLNICQDLYVCEPIWKICVYVWYAYTWYIYICICMYIRISVHKNADIESESQVYILAHLHLFAHTYTHMCTYHMCIYIYIHNYLHIYTYTYLRIHKDLHTYWYTRTSPGICEEYWLAKTNTCSYVYIKKYVNTWHFHPQYSYYIYVQTHGQHIYMHICIYCILQHN